MELKGRCPACREVVLVYARGKHLRVRAHQRSRAGALGRSYYVPCPVAGVDGAAALQLTLSDLESSRNTEDASVTKLELALQTAKERARKAAVRLQAYTDAVAALRAHAEGGTP